MFTDSLTENWSEFICESKRKRESKEKELQQQAEKKIIPTGMYVSECNCCLDEFSHENLFKLSDELKNYY